MKHILFVCTGNTCRSPLAESLLRHMAEKEGLALEVRSAGIYAVDGMPASEETLRILKERGADHKLTAKRVTEEGVNSADLILTMTMGHKQAIIQQFPQIAEKTYTLKEYVEEDPEVLNRLKERQRLLAEMEMKTSLKEQIPEDELKRLAELEKNMPDFDIADPFGGTAETYNLCAAEIEHCLHKLVRKLKGQGTDFTQSAE